MLIAHALISRPRLLLLDEPLANLDLRSAQEVVALLARIAREQKIAVLISAHEMNPLLPVMDRVVYLADGRAVERHRRGGRAPRTCSARSTATTSTSCTSTAGCSSSPARAARSPSVDDDADLTDGGSRSSREQLPRSRSFEPGFFRARPCTRRASSAGPWRWSSGAVGVFTVMRGQSFAGEALGDIGTTGGSGAFLLGVGPLWGFVASRSLAAGVMELIGIQRPRGRDLATGIVLGAGLGLAALFLYLDTTVAQHHRQRRVTILFGSLFAIQSSTIPLVIVARRARARRSCW